MILTVAGKTFTELVGSQEITYDRDAPTVRRKLLCDWADAPTICEAFLGFLSRIGNASLVYTQPQRHPHPKYNYLFAIRANVTGLGVPSQDALGIISYTKAMIDLEYGVPDSTTSNGDQPEITYVSERRQLSAEFVTIPGSRLVYAAADTQAAAAGTTRLGEGARAGKLIPTTRISVDIHHWFNASQKISNGFFDAYAGTCNAHPFVFVDALYGAETLLFNGASFNRQWTSTGTPGWQVTLEFTHKRTGWNRVFRGALGTAPEGFWTYCMTDDKRVYARTDFRGLGPSGGGRTYGFFRAPSPPVRFNPLVSF